MANITIDQLGSFNGVPQNNNLFIIHDGSNAKKITYQEIINKVFSGSTSIVSDGTQHNLTGSIIPTQNSQYDLGSAEYKLRHLYLSSNSLYLGDTNVSEQDYLNKSYITDNTAPRGYNDIGTKGEIRYDSTYVYICVSTNTWVRFNIDSTW